MYIAVLAYDKHAACYLFISTCLCMNAFALQCVYVHVRLVVSQLKNGDL